MGDVSANHVTDYQRVDPILRCGYGSIPVNTIFRGWTSIYQLFWCSPGVQGFDPLPCCKRVKLRSWPFANHSPHADPSAICLRWSSSTARTPCSTFICLLVACIVKCHGHLRFFECSETTTGWWFGTWILWLSIYWECHHPNWRTHIFQRGRSTTNQTKSTRSLG